MDLANLDVLKEKLRNEKELAPVWEYFLSEFGEQPAFASLCEPTQSTFLELVATQISQQLFTKEGKVEALRLMRVPEHKFIHGGCFINGCIAGMLYFEDIELGLLSACEKAPSINVHYARFSGMIRPPASTKPSAN